MTETQRGYAEQLAWLQGKPIPDAYQALDAREATLAPSPYNDAGTQATRDYITAAMTDAIRSTALMASSPR